MRCHVLITSSLNRLPCLPPPPPQPRTTRRLVAVSTLHSYHGRDQKSPSTAEAQLEVELKSDRSTYGQGQSKPTESTRTLQPVGQRKAQDGRFSGKQPPVFIPRTGPVGRTLTAHGDHAHARLVQSYTYPIKYLLGLSNTKPLPFLGLNNSFETKTKSNGGGNRLLLVHISGDPLVMYR